jgi:formylglycine-generating enzyme required for sulfatase activity
MSRAHALLECLGLALCEKARRALSGDAHFGDVLTDVARTALDNIYRELPPIELRLGLAELAGTDPTTYDARLNQLIDGLARVHSVPFRAALLNYLRAWPATARQVLRRPSDPTGRTAPEGLRIPKPDDLLIFLPPRVPKRQIGEQVDDWRLSEFRSLGECSEVWLGTDPNRPDHPPVALKFVTDAAAALQMAATKNLFLKTFELTDQPGVVALRSVYLEADPPCLESAYISGYDLTALLHEWKWRFDVPKPEAALKVLKRLAEIVGKAHKLGFVHRDLKPANVLLHPTEGGKFTLWISDFGWGQLAAAREVELARGGTPRGEQQRLALRGAYTPLYASPQLTRKEPADPRDDVHALGVIWYQLLQRDPHAPPPVGTDWIEELRPAGFTDSQARLLLSCLATRPDKRPADAVALGEQLATVAVATASPLEGSKIISIKSQSGEYAALGKSAKQPGPGGLPRMAANSIGMTLVLIPPGTFTMGSPESECGRRDHEGPQHEVTITRPFYLSIFPVTQGQYEKVMGKNPSHFNKHHGGGPDYPVENVGWHDAERFCERLSLLPDEEMHGRAYRLPTEAEWEYTCRAGTTTAYHCGDKLTPKDAHYAAAGALAKGAASKTAPVGRLSANAWGLFDLHGNVQEWVQDWYEEYYYFDSPKADPHGPPHGQLKVARGGCWVMFGADCRSAARRPHAPDSPSNAIGFRVALVVNSKAK